MHKSPYKILIIEDNPGDLFLIQDYLDEYFTSHNQKVANTFSRAKEILQNHDSHFDIILLDLSLPDLDGMDLVNSIIPLASNIPLVILTGYTDIPFSILTLGQGATDYLLKDELTPFSLYKSIVHNIERKKYLKAIEKSQRKYRDLFQFTPQPIITYDANDLAILDVNEATCKLYGYTTQEFLNLSLLDIRPENEGPYLGQEIKNAMNSSDSPKTYTGIFKHKKKNGEVFTVEVYSNPASLDEKNIRISLINDISERLKYVNEIELQNKKLKEIAWIQSHVVRAPMARIMGLIHLLSHKDLELSDEEQAYSFNGIIDSANELDTIILEITQKAATLMDEKEA